jgi:hypothetical protein
MAAEPHLDRDTDAIAARFNARLQQDQRDRRPTLVHLGDITVTVSHRDLHDPRASAGPAVDVELIRAGQYAAFAATDWEAVLHFELDRQPWQLTAAQVQTVAIALATASCDRRWRCASSRWPRQRWAPGACGSSSPTPAGIEAAP